MFYCKKKKKIELPKSKSDDLIDKDIKYYKSIFNKIKNFPYYSDDNEYLNSNENENELNSISRFEIRRESKYSQKVYDIPFFEASIFSRKKIKNNDSNYSIQLRKLKSKNFSSEESGNSAKKRDNSKIKNDSFSKIRMDNSFKGGKNHLSEIFEESRKKLKDASNSVRYNKIYCNISIDKVKNFFLYYPLHNASSLILKKNKSRGSIKGKKIKLNFILKYFICNIQRNAIEVLNFKKGISKIHDNNYFSFPQKKFYKEIEENTSNFSKINNHKNFSNLSEISFMNNNFKEDIHFFKKTNSWNISNIYSVK